MGRSMWPVRAASSACRSPAARLLDSGAVRLAPCIRYLRDYVAIPSVNPMRRSDLDPAITGERRYAEHLREQLRGIGLDAQLLGSPERPSVLARADAPGAAETVLIASHLDTVPVDGMEIPPFDPALREGRVFGRGSCDTKAGMAALVEALERVLRRGTLRRSLWLVGEADEELGSRGIREVLEHLGDRPAWLLATEPTSLRAVTRHKGVCHTRLVASGVAHHASDPARGRNAIVAMARAVLALEEYGCELARRHDPLLGPATLSAGVIAGGSAPNIVPAEASLLVDRRLLPGEDERGVRAEIEALLAAHGIGDVRIDWCRAEKLPLATPDDHPAALALRSALRAAGLADAPDVAAFGTDAGVAASLGVPGVVFGPGDVAQAHSAREFVETAQVESAVEVLVSILEGAQSEGRSSSSVRTSASSRSVRRNSAE
jgi:acetylornithine deacetylase/succinyl-diaminopimelate desuccinylase-like protein